MGDWRGNSGLDERVIFRDATYNIEDVIYKAIIRFVNGEEITFKDVEIRNITTFEVLEIFTIFP